MTTSPHPAVRYMINVKQIAKFVVSLHDKVAPTDVEEGMRVGVDRTKYQIHIPLPPKIDASVTMMQVQLRAFFLILPLWHALREGLPCAAGHDTLMPPPPPPLVSSRWRTSPT